MSDNPLVIYHRDADGFCAAFIAWLAFRGKGEYASINHGEAPPTTNGREVYVLDFCFDRTDTVLLAGRAVSYTVLDHHKTSQAACGDLDYCHFDVTKCGARLALEHWQTELEALEDDCLVRLRKLVDYVEDRDLWAWKHFMSREVNAWIYQVPLDFDAWLRVFLSQPWVDTAMEVGNGIVKAQDGLIRTALKGAREVVLDGHQVLAANTCFFHSDVAGKLGADRPFGIAWNQKSSGLYRYELRSDGDVDVSEIAKAHGGGGHENAAGFIIAEKLF